MKDIVPVLKNSQSIGRHKQTIRLMFLSVLFEGSIRCWGLGWSKRSEKLRDNA